jgi:hypothetical protein
VRYTKWVKTPRVEDPSLDSTVYKSLSLSVAWDRAKRIYLESVSSCLSGFRYGNMKLSTYDFNSRASREHVVRSPSESPMRRLKALIEYKQQRTQLIWKEPASRQG